MRRCLWFLGGDDVGEGAEPYRSSRAVIALSTALGALTGSTYGYLTAALSYSWPGPPYLPYLLLISTVPILVFLLMIVDVNTRNKLSKRSGISLPSCCALFLITAYVAFLFYFMQRV